MGGVVYLLLSSTTSVFPLNELAMGILSLEEPGPSDSLMSKTVKAKENSPIFFFLPLLFPLDPAENNQNNPDLASALALSSPRNPISGSAWSSESKSSVGPQLGVSQAAKGQPLGPQAIKNIDKNIDDEPMPFMLASPSNTNVPVTKPQIWDHLSSEEVTESLTRIPLDGDWGRSSNRGGTTSQGSNNYQGVWGAWGGTAGSRRSWLWLNRPEKPYAHYFLKIYRKVHPLWSFPKHLEIQMEQGDVLIQFTILHDGSVEDIRIRKSSGYDQFDKNIIAAIRKAAPFGPIPRGLGNKLHILAPFEFDNPMVR